MAAIVELHGPGRLALWPLFQDFPALRGVVSAVIDGGMGIARADHAQEPQVGSLTLHFDLVAGDPQSEHAKPLLHGLRGAIACDAEWEGLFSREFGVGPAYSPRVAFEPGRWDRDRLGAFTRSMPPGFALSPMTTQHAIQFGDLDPQSARNFGSPDALVRDGFGFVALRDDIVAAGVATFAVGGGRVEIEIDTDERFRRQGLATVLGAKMILECLDRGLEPCWDASNPEAAALAEKLGYRRSIEYRGWVFPGSPQG